MEMGLGDFVSPFTPWQSGTGPGHGGKYHGQQRDTINIKRGVGDTAWEEADEGQRSAGDPGEQKPRRKGEAQMCDVSKSHHLCGT